MQQNREYKEPNPKAVAAKLKQVEEFEAKYGETTTSRAWRKWCSDPAYRRREWEFRQAVARSVQPNVVYTD